MYLSEHLERLGFETFQPPEHVERVYFEYIVRCDGALDEMPLETLVAALRAEGCDASLPRYPLLHQQPLFTEGHFVRLARIEGRSEIQMPQYRPDALPRTEAVSRQFLRLPSFPSASREVLDQYVHAFEKVVDHSEAIASAHSGGLDPR